MLQVGALTLLTTATFFPEMYLPQNDWNRGTYRELKAILNELGWTGPASTLDSDHMFFTVDA